MKHKENYHDKTHQTIRKTSFTCRHDIIGRRWRTTGSGVAIMLSGVLSGGHEAERQRIELQARVERLEFCVNHGISPCGPEKLKEWNNAHEPHERFRPQFDGSFAQ